MPICPKSPSLVSEPIEENLGGHPNSTREALPPVKVYGRSKARKLGSHAESDLGKRALEFRKAAGIGKKGNVAVIEYELNGQTLIKEFHTVGKGGRHSGLGKGDWEKDWEKVSGTDIDVRLPFW